MGSRMLAVWECDRCHKLDEGPDCYQPMDWVAIQQTDPPKASFEKATRRVLCGQCYGEFVEWWNGVLKGSGIVHVLPFPREALTLAVRLINECDWDAVCGEMSDLLDYIESAIQNPGDGRMAQPSSLGDGAK